MKKLSCVMTLAALLGGCLDNPDDLGPTGPLAAVMVAERKDWFDSGYGLVGLSAQTGAYRFLDLPDSAEEGAGSGWPVDPELSLDGRLLAYWFVGDPSGDPIGQEDGQRAVVGVAVYDTVAGSVEKVPIPTEHGLSPQGLVWSGDTLFLKANQFQQGLFGENGWARSEGSWHWRRGEQPIRDDSTYGFLIQGAAPDGYLSAGPRGTVVVHADGTHTLVAPRGAFTATPVMSPDGRLAVGVKDPTPVVDDATPLPLAVVDTRSKRQWAIPGARGYEVLGWRDATHVAVANPDEQGQNLVISAVDITTGDMTRISVRPWNDGLPFVASPGIWSAPLDRVEEPRWPMDDRLRAGLWGLGAALLALVAMAWRRRRTGA